MTRPLAIALAALLLLPGAASAQALRATYEVHAAGMVVMEMEARFELIGDAYRIDTRLRTRGIATMMASGDQATHASGGFSGASPRPASYASEGVWRGVMRRSVMDWQGGAPRVLDMTPPNEEEREPVPEAMRHGTVDMLSALAALSRQVARQGGCVLAMPVFDGRRRNDFTVAGGRLERIAPWRGAWHGDALRCEVENRVVAGFRRDQDRATAAEPQRSTAWIAAPYPGAPPLPVRVDIPTRWFGIATAVLLRAEPAERRVDLGR